MTRTIACLDVHGNIFDVSIDDLQWRPSAYGIVIKDNCVLMSKQFGDKYDLPGGGVDLGETLEDAVIREIKEETGIDADNPRNVGAANSFFHASHGNKKSYHSILLYYACKFQGGKLSVDGFDEHEKQYAEIAEWIPLDSIDSIKIASTVDFRPYIRQAILV